LIARTPAGIARDARGIEGMGHDRPTVVAVLGAGTMGRGIAQVFACADFEVHVYDAARGRSDQGVAAIGAQLQERVAKGKLTAEGAASALRRLHPAAEVGLAVKTADVVVEAAPESMEVKEKLLREVVDEAPPEALLASNTSSLSLTEMGARIGAADRTLGLHFFNPPPAIELVEIVRGMGTSEASLERALTLVRAIGKTPIVVRDSPGFATSRLGVLLGAEAIRMVETGVASPADIDRAMELGYRHPMGPLKLTDLVGLDVRLAILEQLHRELGEAFRPPVLLRQMVRAGKLGRKTGEGFYVWKDGVPAPR
jgi:3-hydroxybutyryl-CoA dehydrogenase